MYLESKHRAAHHGLLWPHNGPSSAQYPAGAAGSLTSAAVPHGGGAGGGLPGPDHQAVAIAPVIPVAALAPAATPAATPAQRWLALVQDYDIDGHPDPVRAGEPGFFDAWDPVTDADVERLQEFLELYADPPRALHEGARRHTDAHRRMREMGEAMIKLNPTLRQAPQKALFTLAALMEMRVHTFGRDGTVRASRDVQPQDLHDAAFCASAWDFVRAVAGGMVSYTGAWFAGGMLGITLREQHRLDALQRGAAGAWTTATGYVAGQTFVQTVGLAPRWTAGVGRVDGRGTVVHDHETWRGLFWGFVAYSLFLVSMLGTRWMMPVPASDEASPSAIEAAARRQDQLRVMLGYLATLGVVLSRFVLAPSRRIQPWLAVDPPQAVAGGSGGAPAHPSVRRPDAASLAALHGTLHEFAGFASRHDLSAPRLGFPGMPLRTVVRTLAARCGRDVLRNFAVAVARLVPLRRDLGLAEHVRSLLINGGTLAALFAIVDQYQLASNQTPSGHADPRTVDGAAVAGVLAGWAVATMIGKMLRMHDPMALRDARVDAGRRRQDMVVWGHAIQAAVGDVPVAQDFASPRRGPPTGPRALSLAATPSASAAVSVPPVMLAPATPALPPPVLATPSTLPPLPPAPAGSAAVSPLAAVVGPDLGRSRSNTGDHKHAAPRRGSVGDPAVVTIRTAPPTASTVRRALNFPAPSPARAPTADASQAPRDGKAERDGKSGGSSTAPRPGTSP